MLLKLFLCVATLGLVGMCILAHHFLGDRVWLVYVVSFCGFFCVLCLYVWMKDNKDLRKELEEERKKLEAIGKTV